MRILLTGCNGQAGFELQRTLAPLNAATTLGIVVSKTFTTSETLANARTVRAWLSRALGAAAGDLDDGLVHVGSLGPWRYRGWAARAARARAFWSSVGVMSVSRRRLSAASLRPRPQRPQRPH